MADGHPSSYWNRNDDMADENNFQNRLSNPSDRPAAPSGQGTDPLAELARLIGQNDPFSEFGREQRAPAPAPQRPIPQSPMPQSPVMNEQQLVGQPYAETRGQLPPAYQPQQDIQSFAPMARDVGGHRETGFHDPHQMPASSEFYDEAEPSGRSRGFVTLTAVVVLALIGIGGAFGYRFIFSGSSSSAPPPVIRANTEPTKVPPPPASGESSPGKLAYDRVGDGNQGQRVISREEQPVDPKDLTRPDVSRNSPPQTNSANQWAAAVAPNLPPSSSTASVAQPSSAALGEPKKVRTVPIRPEPTEANMAPPSIVPPGSSQSGSMPNSRVAPAVANNPTFVTPPARAPAVSSPTAPPSSNAPLSLTDDIAAPAMPRTSMTPPPPTAQAKQLPAQRPALAPQQLAAAAPRQQAPAAPTQLAASMPTGGGYLVQVSSQRSEAEAQAALRSVQSKFPNVVGGQPATVRRAELGDRGTFYRAMLGPFASRDQATQLCSSLKAAGGTCIVAGN
jgi:cell division septation protein DedD